MLNEPRIRRNRRLDTQKPPSSRRHQASGQAVVTLNGRDCYLGAWNTPESRSRYDTIIAEWLTGGRRGPNRKNDQAAVTVVELIVRYLRFSRTYYVRANGTPTAEPMNIALALRPLKKLYGRSPAESFGPMALKTVRQAMIEDDLCRTLINKRVNAVRAMFKWAVAEELVSASVLDALKAVSGLRAGRTEARETAPVRPVASADVDAIKAHVSRQVWAMIELQLHTGCRPGEVVKLCARDLNMDGAVWKYEPVEHKTAHRGRSRTIFCGPRAQQVIQPFLADRAVDAPLFNPQEAVAERAALAGTHRRPDQTPNAKKTAREVGECYSTGSYRRCVHRACVAAGIPVWGVGQLRHSAATTLRKEFGLETASLVLGHSSTTLTDSTYAQRDEDKVLAAIARVG